MPKLGSGEVGSVVRWLVAVGDQVEAGVPLAEVDTEKVTTEVEAPTSGRIASLLVSLHDEIPVGTVILEMTPSGAER